MITSFLFFSKLIDAFSNKMDWLKLYLGRICRIMPLYGAVILFLLWMVALLSGFVARESPMKLFTEAAQWLLFMEPNVNGFPSTRLIIYGVQWSLAFEWMFYCSLPLFGRIFFRIRVPIVTLLIATLGLVIFLRIIFVFYPTEEWWRMCQFLGGIPAAFLARNAKAKKWCSAGWLSILFVILLVLVVSWYHSIFDWIPFLCISLFFTCIACGNDLLGLLSLKVCRLLGQVSYSIYLLHGLVLYITINLIVGIDNVAKLSPWRIGALFWPVLSH